jgi:hypothetical protein
MARYFPTARGSLWVPPLPGMIHSFIEGTSIRHFFDIGAGSEDFLSAGNDHDSNLIVPVEFLQRQGQILDQIVGEGVELLRPIESDYGDGVVFFDDDVRKIHTVQLFRNTPWDGGIQVKARAHAEKKTAQNRGSSQSLPF